jgi:hypothetical protein
MRPSEQPGTPATRADQFNLFASRDRDPSLASIGVRLRERYGSIPSDLIPDRLVQLLDQLDRSAPPAI